MYRGNYNTQYFYHTVERPHQCGVADIGRIDSVITHVPCGVWVGITHHLLVLFYI